MLGAGCWVLLLGVCWLLGGVLAAGAEGLAAGAEGLAVGAEGLAVGAEGLAAGVPDRSSRHLQRETCRLRYVFNYGEVD